MAQQVQGKLVIRNDVQSDNRSSSVFVTVFDNKPKGQICADNGADGSNMDGCTLRAIEGTGADIEVEKLYLPRVFKMAAAPPDGKRTTLTCTNIACINTALKIRHGSELVLNNIRWLIMEQSLSDFLLGHHLLGALGLTTRWLLAAAACGFPVFIDAERLVRTIAVNGDGRTSRVIQAMFYADGAQHTVEEDDTHGARYDIGEEIV